MKLLKKLFIKNYDDTSNPSVRARYGAVAGVFGMATNVVLCALKAVIGVLAGSIAIIADAVNNFTDAGSSVMTFIGFKLSSKPADERHPYGHARFESVTALIVSLSVFAVGVLLLKSSVEKIFVPEEVTVSVWTFAALGVAIAVKFIQTLVYRDFAATINSDAIRAQAADARNDMISSAATLIAMAVIYFTDVNVDAYVGLAVSVFVIVTSIKMILNPVNALIGSVLPKETVGKIKEIISSRKEILGIHDLIIHDYGEGHRFASVHAEVDSNSSIVEVHSVVDSVEREVASKTGVQLSVHTDPVDVTSKERLKYRAQVENAVADFDSAATIHDFSVCEDGLVTKISFDIVEPYGKVYDVDGLKRDLSAAFGTDKTFEFLINVDHGSYD